MTKVIGDYTAAATIDGSTHYLLIQPGSSSTPYKKINRNVFLGVTAQPMDISSSQNVTNKTLDNTNTITLKDTLFTLQDDGDATKQAKFQLSGITTATTRTYTLPNASSTLADIATSQTFTNKTLTSPVITGGSIDNTTITVDSIAGHTSSTTGTIYGISVTAAKISGAVISNTTIPYTALTTDSTWAYSTFVPSPTGYSGTPTTTLARYKQVGKTVFMDISFTGTSSATTCTFTLPVAAKSVASYQMIPTDNSSVQTSPGLITLAAASTTATCFKTLASGAFTGSGTKAVQVFGLTYEAN